MMLPKLLFAVRPSCSYKHLLTVPCDVGEARRGQTHLDTYFSTQSQTRRIWALSKFPSNIRPYLTFKLLRPIFEAKDLLQIPTTVYKLFSFSSLIRYFTFRRVSPIHPAKKSLGTFLIYHCITAGCPLLPNYVVIGSRMFMLNCQNYVCLSVCTVLTW